MAFFFSNSHFKLHHCSCRNCRWCKVLLVLRNTLSGGSLVSSCSGSSGRWEPQAKGDWLQTLCIIKGMGTCAHPDDQTLRDMTEAEEPKTSMCLDYESIKPRIFSVQGLSSEVPAQAVNFFMVIASRLNYFKDWDIWDSAIGKLVLSQ